MHIKSKDSWLKHFDFILWDLVIYALSFFMANLLYLGRTDYYSTRLYYVVFACIVLPCFFIDLAYDPFSSILRRGTITEIRNAVEYTAYNFVFTVVLLYVFKLGSLFSRAVLFLTYIIYLILIILVRVLWKRLLVKGVIRFGSKTNKSLLIIAPSKEFSELLNNINKEEYLQYDITGLCATDKDMTGETIANYPVLCNKDDIYKCAVKHNIGEVFISVNPNEIENDTVRKLVDEGIGIHLDIKKIYGFEVDEQNVSKVGIYKTLGLGLYTFTAKQTSYLILKRIFDIIISLLVMIPLGLVAILVKILYVLSGDRESIFYDHVRVGQNGKLFKMHKFRTMIPNSQEVLEELLKDEKNLEEWNEYHKLKDDPRITKAGKILRKTSLDELPQFINVLQGDMSLIGPRPLVEGELKMHNGLKLYEKVKPGITGWWACNGRSNISYEERLDLEYYYVKNCSLSLDILTILRTVYVVISRKGAE